MLQAQPTSKNIKVVGSNSKNVYLLFKNLMQDIYSLLCDIHMKDILMGERFEVKFKERTNDRNFK